MSELPIVESVVKDMISHIRITSFAGLVQRVDIAKLELQSIRDEFEVFSGDAIRYARDGAWAEAEVLCWHFVELQQQRWAALRFFWIDKATRHLISAAKAAGSNRNGDYQRLSAIVRPLIDEAISAMDGFITASHSLSRDVFSKPHVDATEMVAKEFDQLNSAFDRGIYARSVYRAASCLKSLSLLWSCREDE